MHLLLHWQNFRQISADHFIVTLENEGGKKELERLKFEFSNQTISLLSPPVVVPRKTGINDNLLINRYHEKKNQLEQL